LRFLVALVFFFAFASRAGLEATSIGTVAVTATVSANCIVTTPGAGGTVVSIVCTDGALGATVAVEDGSQITGVHGTVQPAANASTERNRAQTVSYVLTSARSLAIPLYAAIPAPQRREPARSASPLIAMVNF
jgi:hypothetical protein